MIKSEYVIKDYAEDPAKITEVYPVDFHFIPGIGRLSDIPYSLALGDNVLGSFLSEWSNDFEYIRHTLEDITFFPVREARVELNDEESPVIIDIKKCRLLRWKDEKAQGAASANDDFLHIHITPDEFAKVPEIDGYCKPKDFIKRLYDGLLWMTRHCNIENWEISAVDAYKKMKSGIIEGYLKDEDTRYAVQNRQPEVERIMTIMPDSLWCVLSEFGGPEYSVDSDDMLNYGPGENDQVIIPGLYGWYKQFDNAVDYADAKLPDDFPYAEWNNKGLELAHEMRKKLPETIDLWYAGASEDRSGTIKQPILIL